MSYSGYNSGKGSHTGLSGRSLSGGQPYRVGDRIGGRYEIQQIFGGEGKSAMGVVYQCYDREHDRVIALKTLQDKYLHSKRLQDNFKKEALAWIQLDSHPHIVRAFWVQELDGRICIACEFIMPDGEGRNTLTHYFGSSPDLRQVLVWAIQFCHGMEYARSRGVSPHRDVKPDNIMITFDNILKITDFGLVGLWSKAENAEEVRALVQNNKANLSFLSVESNRVVAGSPPRMAPEQFYGVAEVRSDVYGFGVVLFQMLNRGRHPFTPKAGDNWNKAHKTYPVPDVGEMGKPLRSLIQRCLEKRRENRYTDFSEVRAEIEKVFEKEVKRKTGERAPAAPKLEKLAEGGLINKGLSLANLGLLDEGIRKYREGLKLNPGNAPARYNLANALAEKGRIDEAISEYREAIMIDRDFLACHFNLARALQKKGALDDAARHYRETLRINPKFVEGYLCLGALSISRGLVDEAIASYGKAVSIAPDHAEAYQRLGHALMKKELYDEAIRAFQESVRHAPDAADCHCSLGTVLSRRGRHDEAIQAFGKTLMLKPGNADAYYGIGFAFARKDLVREAFQAFGEFLRIADARDPRRAKVGELHAKLKKML